MQVLDRYAELGIRVVVCAHERVRKLVVLQNAGDSELRIKWAATDVDWARPLYPNDELAERNAWPHADLVMSADLAPNIASDGCDFVVVGTQNARLLGEKYTEHGELLHEVRVPFNEQLLDPKRDQLELGLSFQHTKVGEYTGTLLLHSNDPLRRFCRIPITLSVQLPKIRLGVEVLDVTVPWNDTSEHSVAVHNVGEAPLRIEAVDIGRAEFITTAFVNGRATPIVGAIDPPLVLNRHDPPAMLKFVFERSQPGQFSGLITLQTNDRSLKDSSGLDSDGKFDLPVEVVVVQPELRAECLITGKPSLAFTVARESRKNQIVRLHNDGEALAVITDIVVDAHSCSWLHASAEQLPVKVAPKSCIDFGVRCTGPSDDAGGWKRHSHITIVADTIMHKVPVALDVLLPRVCVKPEEMIVAVDGTWEGFQYLLRTTLM